MNEILERNLPSWRELQYVFRRMRPTEVLSDGRCPDCGYDLRDDFENGCPECGWNRTAEDSNNTTRSNHADA